MAEKIDVARAYEKAIRMLIDNPSFFIIALIPLAVQLIINYLISSPILIITQTINNAISNGNLLGIITLIPAMVGASIIGLLINLIVYPLVIGAYITGTNQVIEGKQLNLNKALSESLSKIIKLIITVLLSALLVIAGLILLIIPGLILLLMLFYVIPAAVLEKKGITQTIRHSLSIGSKNFKNTFLFLIIAVIINIPVGFLDPFTSSVLSALLVTPLISIAYGVTYLKVIKK